MYRWDEETVRHVYDSVLVGSVVEFRRALELLEDNDVPAEGHYVLQIREGLRMMEQELRRRDLRIAEDSEASRPDTLWEQPLRDTSA